MNLYQIIGFLILIIILGQVFHLAPAVENMATGLGNVPVFDEKGNSPHLFDLAVRLAYLIALVAVVKIVFGKNGTSNEE